MNERVRLQKYLAHCGVASRRKAEEMIAAGRVKVNGRVVEQMGQLIDPDGSEIRVDGHLVGGPERHVYLLLNKPKGYVTTVDDPQGRPIVTSLLRGVNQRVYPVGRLDVDTEGALLLTNDGDLTQKMLHPKFQTKKTYQATVAGMVREKGLTALREGVVIEGKVTSPATVRILERARAGCLVEITIHEGRKHQVKKMFAHIGHPVQALRRTAYGKLALGNLPLGQVKTLNQSDLKKIFL